MEGPKKLKVESGSNILSEKYQDFIILISILACQNYKLCMSVHKISWSVMKITEFVHLNVSVGGTQLAKLGNLKFYNICSV